MPRRQAPVHVGWQQNSRPLLPIERWQAEMLAAARHHFRLSNCSGGLMTAATVQQLATSLAVREAQARQRAASSNRPPLQYRIATFCAKPFAESNSLTRQYSSGVSSRTLHATTGSHRRSPSWPRNRTQRQEFRGPHRIRLECAYVQMRVTESLQSV